MKRHIWLAATALLLALPAAAQNTYSGYFIDNYLYRYQMNPAFGNERAFFGFPVLGNLNIGFSGNLHLTDVLYNVDGKTVLFTNPNISVAEAMKGIGDKNRIGTSNRIDIVNVGFKALGGYNTVSINARVDADFKVPGAFFSLAKEGISNETYDIKHIGAQANAYAEIALGHSRDITSQWRVGGALKFLVGIANIDARFNEAKLALGEDSWTATTDAEIRANVKGMQFKHDVNDRTGREYVSGVDMGSFSAPNGFGMALDLGATYRLNDDWQFSAAILDLGFISWGNTLKASTNGVRTVDTDAFTFNPDDEADNSFSNEWERLRDDFAELYELTDDGKNGSTATSLATTINLGADYTFPLYRNLKFGMLNTTRINGSYSWTRFRLSANVQPVKCFAAGINFAAGTFGCEFGWIANLNLKGFSLFLGMDRTLGKLCKQGIPLSSNGSFNFGIDFPLN